MPRRHTRPARVNKYPLVAVTSVGVPLKRRRINRIKASDCSCSRPRLLGICNISCCTFVLGVCFRSTKHVPSEILTTSPPLSCGGRCKSTYDTHTKWSCLGRLNGNLPVWLGMIGFLRLTQELGTGLPAGCKGADLKRTVLEERGRAALPCRRPLATAHHGLFGTWLVTGVLWICKCGNLIFWSAVFARE